MKNGVVEYWSGGVASEQLDELNKLNKLNRLDAMNTVLALSSLVIKEFYRRKDFYVLFVLTAVITLLMGSVNFFNDPQIVRYIKEVCLLLIWLSALIIAIV